MTELIGLCEDLWPLPLFVIAAITGVGMTAFEERINARRERRRHR